MKQAKIEVTYGLRNKIKGEFARVEAYPKRDKSKTFTMESVIARPENLNFQISTNLKDKMGQINPIYENEHIGNIIQVLDKIYDEKMNNQALPIFPDSEKKEDYQIVKFIKKVMFQVVDMNKVKLR